MEKKTIDKVVAWFEKNQKYATATTIAKDIHICARNITRAAGENPHLVVFAGRSGRKNVYRAYWMPLIAISADDIVCECIARGISTRAAILKRSGLSIHAAYGAIRDCLKKGRIVLVGKAEYAIPKEK